MSDFEKGVLDVTRELSDLVYDLGQAGRPYPFEGFLEEYEEFNPNADEGGKKVIARLDALLRKKYGQGRQAV